MEQNKAVVILGIVLTFLSTAVALLAVSRNFQSAGLVTHTLAVKTAANQLQGALVDAETGVRGYLIGRDRAFLGPYEAARPVIGMKVAELTKLVADDPEQLTRVQDIGRISFQRLAHLDSTLKVAERGEFDAAFKMVADKVGMQWMSEARQQIAALLTTEDQLLAMRSHALDVANRWLIFAMLTTLAGAVLIATNVSRAFRENIKALEAANSRLEEQVEKRTADLAAAAMRQGFALDAGALGVWELAANGTSSIRSSRHDEIFGHPEPLAQWTLDDFFRHVHPDDVERTRRELDAAQAEKRPWIIRSRIYRADDHTLRWIEGRGAPQLDKAGNVTRYVGVVGDITEKAIREENLAIVSEELGHRLKNLLTIVQAISMQTARGATNVDEFTTGLNARLAGLSRSQNLLLGRGGGADLGALVRAQATNFACAGQLTASGPAVTLGNSSAQMLGLALYELSTNAAKYGAFSTPAGLVAVTWSIDDTIVNFEWRETGGPPLEQPTRQGFGSKILNTIAAQSLEATVQTTYYLEGLRWTAKLPLPILAR